MNIFEFSELTLPAVENKLEPRKARRLMASIGSLMLGQRYDTFNEEGKDVSPPWAPLSRRYAAWKLKKHRGKSSKILSLSNALRMSFSASSARATKPDGDGSLTVSESEAMIETHVPYAAALNYGAQRTIKAGEREGEVTLKKFEKGKKRGRHAFASPDEMGPGKNFSLVRRSWKVNRSYATYVTLPARRFDTFSENDTGEIRELIEDFIK